MRNIEAYYENLHELFDFLEKTALLEVKILGNIKKNT